jgi:amino acid adenylation domain-containing protein
LRQEHGPYELTEIDFDPFEDRVIQRVAPAIEPQMEIWVSCMMGGDDANRSYNESVMLYLNGRVDTVKLELALGALVERHEALRSCFSGDGRQVIIYEGIDFAIRRMDLGELDKQGQVAALDDFAKEDANKAFDLFNGPLFRFALIKLSDKRWVLKITAHHIVCDGWSLGILLQDLGKLYSGKPAVLPDARCFSQYAMEQWDYSGTEEFASTVDYWIDQYKEIVPVLNLPTDFERPTVRTYKSHRDDFAINGDLSARVKAMGAKAGCSFVTTLLSAFEIFLFRLTGQPELVLGLPAAGQSVTGNEALVGHCVNLLPLRSKVKGEEPFLDYLKARKKQLFDDYEHQRFTFGTLLKKLNIQRDPSRVPLVPVVFNIDMGLDNGVSFEGIEHRLGYTPREYENFELFLNASGSEKLLVLEWSYNTQLFKASTIARMMDEFTSLLEFTSSHPDTRIQDIPKGREDELWKKLKDWNDTRVEYPRDLTLVDLFEKSVELHREKIALRFGKKAYTYEALNEVANRFAAMLKEEGIGCGKLVGISVDRSAEMVVVMLGIAKAGAAYLPLDPLFPQKRIEFMLADSAANLLISSKKYKGRFGPLVREILVEEVWQKLDRWKGENGSVCGSRDLAYLLYTSGSTGNPKGVQIEQHSLVNFLLSMKNKPGIKASDRLLAVSTISFDIAGLEIYLPLISGAELVLADSESVKDGRMLLDLIGEREISIMQATPSTWRMLIEAGWEKKLALKVLCGGEALPRDLAENLIIRSESVWNMYGPTETTIWSAVSEVAADEPVISIGRPIDNTQILILDEHGKPVPEGSVGEIYIGGEGVARGYLNRQDLNGEKFLEEMFPGPITGRFYRTGDLGKWMEGGLLQCLGRIDHQVKIHGYRIELEEIEQALLKQEGIRQAVVTASQDRLRAFIVSDGDNSPSIVGRWKQCLSESLPAYMVPADFTPLDQIPLTPNGKIDRESLMRLAGPAGGTVKERIEPRTDTEKLIAGIWKSVLGIQTIGVKDDFFEMGGHSLIAVQAMTQLEKQTGRRLPLASLLEAPTIEKLSRLLLLEESAVQDDHSLVTIKANGKKIPLYIVHGFGMNVLLFNYIARNMDADQPVFALQAKGLHRGAAQLPDNMEGIATEYLSEVLKRDPNGPYALAGYSFGGIIAFEMATQLRAMGKEVKMLAMFDTYADNSTYFDPYLQNIKKKVGRQFPKLLFIVRSLFIQPKKTILYQRDFVKNKVRSVLGRADIYEDEGASLDPTLAQKYDHAYMHYKMSPYNGTIDLFRVKNRLYYLDDLVYLGWKPFARRGVKVYEIGGDHKTFLYPPHDKAFGKILQEVLDQHAAEPDNTNYSDGGIPFLKVV